MAKMAMKIRTVDPFNSSQVGQLHLRNSSRVSRTYAARRTNCPAFQSQANTITATTLQMMIHVRSLISFSALSFYVSKTNFKMWRRGRDSNPRRPLSRSGFQDRRNRPLCHLSRSAECEVQNKDCSRCSDVFVFASSFIFILRSALPVGTLHFAPLNSSTKRLAGREGLEPPTD